MRPSVPAAVVHVVRLAPVCRRCRTGMQVLERVARVVLHLVALAPARLGRWRLEARGKLLPGEPVRRTRSRRARRHLVDRARHVAGRARGRSMPPRAGRRDVVCASGDGSCNGIVLWVVGARRRRARRVARNGGEVVIPVVQVKGFAGGRRARLAEQGAAECAREALKPCHFALTRASAAASRSRGRGRGRRGGRVRGSGSGRQDGRASRRERRRGMVRCAPRRAGNVFWRWRKECCAASAPAPFLRSGLCRRRRGRSVCQLDRALELVGSSEEGTAGEEIGL